MELALGCVCRDSMKANYICKIFEMGQGVDIWIGSFFNVHCSDMRSLFRSHKDTVLYHQANTHKNDCKERYKIGIKYKNSL